MIHEGCSESYDPGVISLLPAMQHGWKLSQIIIYSLSITAWQVLCNLKERPEIYAKTVIPSMHWPIKQTVHIRDLIIQTIAVSAIRFHGCSIFIHKPTCPVQMANFLYDLGFPGPLMYGYATVSYNQFWPLEVLTGPNCHNNSCIKGKKNWGKLRFTYFCMKQLWIVSIAGDW